MKKQVLVILLLIVFTQSCIKDNNSSPCGDQIYNYQTLDSTSKSKVPYLKKQFDTISYASNKGDTLVFVRQAKDSNWYCKDYYSNKDCLPNYNCYETYGAKYTCIKGNGSFQFKHGKGMEIILFKPFRTYFVLNNIYLLFNGINFNIGDDQIDSKTYQDYVGDTIINGIMYKETIKLYSTKDNENYSYINKENGMIHFVDNLNNSNWTIYK